MQENHSDSAGPGNGKQLGVKGYQSQGKQLCGGVARQPAFHGGTVKLLRVSREESQGLNTQNPLSSHPAGGTFDESSDPSEGSPLRQSRGLEGGEQSGGGCRVDLRDKWEISSTDGQKE